MERFYSIEHLSTRQLQELFTAYRQAGEVDYGYYRLTPEGTVPAGLPDAEIVRNIKAGNPHNYFVYMLHHEDEPDGIMIGFGLTNHPTFGAYLHLDKSLLGEIVEKYRLEEKQTKEFYPQAPGSGLPN